MVPTIRFTTYSRCMVLFLVLALSLVSSVLADEYEDFVTEADVFTEEDMTLYVQAPDTVFTHDDFSIQVLPELPFDNGTITLSRDDIVLDSFLVSTLDDATNTSHIFLRWDDVIETNTTYTLHVFNQERRIYTTSFDVVAEEKTVLEKDTRSVYVNAVSLTQEERTTLREDISSYVGYEITPLEMTTMLKNAKDYVQIKKEQQITTTTFEDGQTLSTTEVNLAIDSEQTMERIIIIEYIPKEFAATASEIDFKGTIYVIEEDPVILWDLEGMPEEELGYAVSKETQATGNTIALAVVSESQDERSINWKVIIPLLLIPLIAVIIIGFNKYQPKK